MNAQKMTSLLLFASILMISTIPGTFATYDTFSMPTQSSYKIQRLINIEPRLDSYIEGQLAKRIRTLDDKKLARFYLVEIGIQKEKLKQVFDNLQYVYSDTDYPEKLSEIRTNIIAIRDLINEAEKSQAQGIDPFVISDADRNSVETGILSGQKDLATYLREILQIYTNQDTKRSNPSSFHFESELGTVDVNLEKNSSILSWITGNQELDLSLSANIDLKIPNNSTINTNTDFQSIKGTIQLDGEIKIIGSDMYLTLHDYSIDISSNKAIIRSEIASMKTALDAFKGKTVHIALPANQAQLDREKITSTLQSILGVLEKEPLLTPYKKIDTTFALEPKRATLDSISKVASTQMIDDNSFLDIRKAFHVSPLWYGIKTNGFDLWTQINEGAMTGKVQLSQASGTYIFTTNLSNQSGDYLISEIRNDYVKIDGKSENSTLGILWENKTLTSGLSGMGQHISISGPLSLANTDLKITYNNQNIGSIKSSGTEAHLTYEINFGLDIPSVWKFSWKGTADVEHGTFTIDTPTDTVELQKILPGASDSFESGAINPLDF